MASTQLQNISGSGGAGLRAAGLDDLVHGLPPDAFQDEAGNDPEELVSDGMPEQLSNGLPHAHITHERAETSAISAQARPCAISAQARPCAISAQPARCKVK
jgi:hypothetical protein